MSYLSKDLIVVVLEYAPIGNLTGISYKSFNEISLFLLWDTQENLLNFYINFLFVITDTTRKNRLSIK